MKIIKEIEKSRFSPKDMKDIIGGANYECVDYCKNSYKTTPSCVAGYHVCPTEYSSCNGQGGHTCMPYKWKTK